METLPGIAKSKKDSIFRDKTPCSPLELTDFSEEHVTSIFRAQE
jgi:hypothetical protein